MSGNSSSGEDEILEMFFDEGFVPHAFVDILLSNAASRDVTQVQAASSTLLSRLDFYTKNLTKELEMTIQRLEKLSETLPGTWTVEMDTMDKESLSAIRSSKLEYYLDTLSSAVRVLEADMTKINGQLSELDTKYESSGGVVEKLQNLEKIKGRLNTVLALFTQVKTILQISANPSGQNSRGVNNVLATVEQFRSSLDALQDTICQSLAESARSEGALERNEELLKKIDVFTELKPLFKGLDNFYPIYSQFVTSIKSETQNYLATKDIGGDLNS